MNRKQLFKKAALSTLMISAIASPLVANAAVGPAMSNHYAASQLSSDAKKTTNTDSKKLTNALTATVTAVELSDPLKIAKTYAPESVQDWEKVLAKYDELVKSKLSIGIVSDSASVVMDTAQTGEGSIASQATISTSLQPLSEGSAPGKGIAQMQKLVVLPAGEQPALTMTRPVEVTDSKPASALRAADHVSIAIQASPAADSFFQSQIDLNEAVKSKDAATIKPALAKLYKQYQAQIEKLEQLK